MRETFTPRARPIREMAYASAKEVESELILSRGVNFLSSQQFEDLSRRTDHVARLCFGLTKMK